MKFRNFLVVAAGATFAFASCKPAYQATDTDTTGTTSTSVTVSPAIQTAFTTQYPNATNVVWSNYDMAVEAPIDWEMAGWTALQNDDYLVRFDMDNENYYAWYDNDGNWIGSAYTMRDHTQLPRAVTTLISERYADYTIDKVDREFQKDRMAYEIKLKKADDSKVKLLIDADGNVLKEKIK